MSKKKYTLFQVDEWRKKYGDNTQTHMKTYGFNYGADSIGGEIILSTLDDQTPERGQLFLVTMEPIDRATLEGGDSTYNNMVKFFTSLREKDAIENSGMKTGRKFR